MSIIRAYEHSSVYSSFSEIRKAESFIMPYASSKVLSLTSIRSKKSEYSKKRNFVKPIPLKLSTFGQAKGVLTKVLKRYYVFWPLLASQVEDVKLKFKPSLITSVI